MTYHSQISTVLLVVLNIGTHRSLLLQASNHLAILTPFLDIWQQLGGKAMQFCGVALMAWDLGFVFCDRVQGVSFEKSRIR